MTTEVFDNTDPHHGGKISCARCSSLDIIGISDGDSIGYWRCKTCDSEWPRGGGNAEFARRNIDRMRKERRQR